MAGTIVADTIRADSTSTLVLRNGVANTPPTIQDSAGTQIGTFCRAWVNWNGTTNVGGFCTIRGSFNVTSVTDSGTGQYIVNFTNAMPDTNYASPIEYSRLFGGFSASDVNRFVSVVAKTTTSVSVQSTIATGPAFDDITSIGVAIFR